MSCQHIAKCQHVVQISSKMWWMKQWKAIFLSFWVKEGKGFVSKNCENKNLKF